MSETVCVWERERVSEREVACMKSPLEDVYRDGAVLVALGYNSAACLLLMSGDTTILMNSHYGKVWRNRAPELPEPLTLGVKFLHTSGLSQLAIITPEALNSCCVFIFLFKLTRLALITKFRQPSVCQPRRQRPPPPPQKEMGVISMIAVCVLPPFHLIVLYGVPASIKDLRRLTILKNTHPTDMFQKHPKLQNKTQAIGRERCSNVWVPWLNFSHVVKQSHEKYNPE